ncbi:MAG: peptidoglycan recognition family protein [Tepidisphaeraceae bacterium]|jgi:hypothetical protein
MTRFLAIIGLMLLGGCVDSSVDDGLPAPVMSAPVVLTPPPTVAPPRPVYHAPPPVAVAPEPAPEPRMQRSEAVPAAWIPNVPANKWNWIIVHHSDSDYGSAAIIDQWHRARGFDELGYHFVIGNGTNSGDGQIEVGPRWTKQKWGAHDNALDNRYNMYGIGICLVGNFDKYHPTAAQRRSLLRLTEYLMRTYNIPVQRVLGHGETKDTHCPGLYLSVAGIRAEISRQLASGNFTDDPADDTAELAAEVEGPATQPSSDATAGQSSVELLHSSGDENP